jgi:hypothetical protein
MNVDYRTARMRTHRRNIQRYSRLLATKLTDLERRYLHRQIAEEQAELERLAREGRALAGRGVIEYGREPRLAGRKSNEVPDLLRQAARSHKGE